jgi:hypothetical protein
MIFLRTIFNFYIDASIHVALAVVSLVWITAFEYQFDLSYYLLGFVFFGTITGYNFVKYARAAGLHHKGLTHSLKSIQIFSFVCFGIVLYCILNLPTRILGVTAVFGVLTFLYTVPLLKKKNLRTISGLKIFVVALVWAGVTVSIPLVWNHVGESFPYFIENSTYWATFFQRFLLVIVWTFSFEIRDLRYDDAALKTLPQLFGVGAVKILGVVFLLGAILLEFIKDFSHYPLHEEIGRVYMLGLLLMGFLTLNLLLATRKKQSRYFASFWVESIPIVWMCMLFFL